MINAKKLVLPSAISCIVAGAAMPGFAQEATEQQAGMLEEVVVTGIRRGLMDSIAMKRESSSVIEAISAEDIGKLPGTSIADSLSRLPGVTTQRISGRPSVVSIRGLGPDFTAATLNGREQVSTNDNRAIEFDQYPQELLTAVQVYKTPDATLTNQGLAGTVNMDTISPLKHGERTISVNIRGEYNDTDLDSPSADDDGHRATFTYIDQYLDDTLGVAFGVTDMSNPIQEERFNAWGFPATGDGDLVIGGAKPFILNSLRDRTSYLTVVEWEPNDRFKTSFDGFYSEFNQLDSLKGIELPLAWGKNQLVGAQVNEGPFAAFDGGLVQSGTFNNVEPVIRNDRDEQEAEIISLGSNTRFQITDSWSATADLSYSRAERESFSLETYFNATGRGIGDGVGIPVGFIMTSKGAVFSFPDSIDFADPDLVKLGGAQDWGNDFSDGEGPADVQDGFINNPEIEDEITAIDLSTNKLLDNNWISDVTFGVKWQNREKEREDTGTFLRLKDFLDDQGNPQGVDIPTEFLGDPSELPFGLGQMISVNGKALFDAGFFDSFDAANVDTSRTVESWVVEEDVVTSYAMLNIDASIADIPLTGNVGLQWVYTDQESSGGAAVPTGDGKVDSVPVTEGETYVEYLPSLNLKLEFLPGHQINLNFAQTLSRARMDDLKASASVSFDSTRASSTDIFNAPFGSSSGNPDLRPTEVTQYDLGYSFYFGESNYLSAATFFKDISNLVTDSEFAADFSDFPVPPPTQPEDIASFIGIDNQPTNAGGGNLWGWELSGNLTGDIITEYLRDFGLTFGAAFVDEDLDLIGTSRYVYNGELYYTRSGFEARISYRYRSSFLGEVSGLSLLRETRNIQSEEIVDAQINYSLDGVGPAYLDGLTLSAQVTNLFNEPTETVQDGSSRLVRDHKTFGRNFLVGFSYKF